MNRPLLSLLLGVALACGGCASKSPAPAQSPPPDTSPIRTQEATPQQRAAIRTELAAGYYERGQMDVAHQCDQVPRVGRLVVDAVEHHVLERDEVARRPLEVAQARGHQAFERVLAVDRHQTVAQRVGRRVQRHGERDRALVAQPIHPRDEAGRRHRHAPA